MMRFTLFREDFPILEISLNGFGIIPQNLLFVIAVLSEIQIVDDVVQFHFSESLEIPPGDCLHKLILSVEPNMEIAGNLSYCRKGLTLKTGK